jgi:type II secretory pathway pseudopilin PulG
MMEIAISLAIIGFALVAIIGVLPIGMNVQQDNRQETAIAADASVLMEDVRNGALAANDLTNYVYAITNYWAHFTGGIGGTNNLGVNTYTFSSYSVSPNYWTLLGAPLTNGANIIGLLSTPELTDGSGNPLNNISFNGGYSNHIVAYVYSISGPAVNKPPQDNTLMQQDSFTYRVYVVNAPIAQNTNDWMYNNPTTNEIIQANILHELRMTFEWPQLPNGNLGSGRQTYRTSVAGTLLRQPTNLNLSVSFNTNVYVYLSQSFTNTP